MSQQLINLNADLRKMREEGYDIDVRHGHLIVKDVPYVNGKREVRRGALVTSLELNGDKTQQPTDHTVFFQGDHPCTAEGSTLTPIQNSSNTQTLAPGIIVNHRFSAKPKTNGRRYRDYHHKMTTYVSHISGPARQVDPQATAQTGAIVEPSGAESPFQYLDTASSKAGITEITSRLEGLKIAIVGVGGTGTYILDLVAKTPVSEIHLFDGDVFSNHNAFRAPGSPSLDDLRQRPLKVSYFQKLYSQMHRGIQTHEDYLHEGNIDDLQGMNFVFLCLDKGAEKQPVVEKLEEWDLPFIDVGLGINIQDNMLRGAVRTTASTTEKRDHFRGRVGFGDSAEDEYSTNIQIAELNMLNAALAVIKWKKLFGLYQDGRHEHCSIYKIATNSIVNDDLT